MLTLLGMFSRASAKLLATFVMVIALMIGMFAVAPGLITALQDLVEGLDAVLRDPPLNEQGTVLYRTLVNENTVFGIVMTIIARALVELIAWAGGSLWRQARGDDAAPSGPGPGGASAYYER